MWSSSPALTIFIALKVREFEIWRFDGREQRKIERQGCFREGKDVE